MNNLTAANAARLENALDREYDFGDDDGIQSLRDYIDGNAIEFLPPTPPQPSYAELAKLSDDEFDEWFRTAPQQRKGYRAVVAEGGQFIEIPKMVYEYYQKKGEK